MNPGYFVLTTMLLLFFGIFAFGCALFSGGSKSTPPGKHFSKE
jgi:hypothetical protein